jgi:cell division protein FtsB
MVIRRRWRAIVFPLILYAVSGSVTSYFVWHANNGERGMKTKDENQTRLQALSEEFASLQSERKAWQHRVEMMRAETVDRDLLDEQARLVLGRVGKNDLVLQLQPNTSNETKR